MDTIAQGLNGLGVLVAAVGLIKTWRLESPEERFFGAVSRALRRAWIALAVDLQAYWRMLRGRPPPTFTGVGNQTAPSAAMNGRAHAGYPPLDRDLDLASAVGELDKRTRDLMMAVGGVQNELRAERDALQRALDERAAGLDRRINDIEAHSRRMVVSGVRWEATGLALVALGTALGMFA